MGRYLTRRLIQLIPLLLLTTVVSFAVMQLAPGGPLSAYEHSPSITAAQLKVIEHDLGLDQPAYIQYFRWITGIVHGQWGYSLQSGEAVTTLILGRLGNTMELIGAAFLICLLISIPLGVFTAVFRYSLFDYSATLLTFIAYSTPVFWAGLMAQLLFSVRLGWLPVAGMYTEGVNWALGDALKHLVLPAFVLGLGLIAGWSRYLRSSMLEVMQQDYLRTARAKGLPGRSVVFKHALRNAVVPLVTVMALDVPLLFTGALVVEVVFSWPGEGRLFYDSLQNRDYPVLMGVLLVSAFLILGGNLVADMLYGWLNPRVRYD
jgi:peptide/nickel transport system permease protein